MHADTLMYVTSEVGFVISTQRQGDQAFQCRIFEIAMPQKEANPLRLISEGFEAVTCLEAQTHAYHYVQRIYPMRAEQLKKPPI